jgi:hypothetical protein
VATDKGGNDGVFDLVGIGPKAHGGYLVARVESGALRISS